MYELLDAVEAMATIEQENAANASQDEQHLASLSPEECGIVQNSSLQQIDGSNGKELSESLSDHGVNIEDDEDSVFEYTLIPMGQDEFLRPSESWDEITIDDVIVGLLCSSSGYSSGSSSDAISLSLEDPHNLDDTISSSLEDARNVDDTLSLSLEDSQNLDDNISSSLEDAQWLDGIVSFSLEDDQNLNDTIPLSLEDARNLDDEDFLPSDPSAEMMGDANEDAHLAAEIEFLERMIGYFFEGAFFDEPEQQGAGDTGMEPEELPDMD
ncbi:hypothetical protein JTE90_018366 [Oedothorax gibbosus]|uniref:Uncharacterized protein n=1 Tax=Oedothorax gibbosus TaxID=931172 RepID=A0AAV6TVG2_9ARAC|nr:hypothetical protein JTE90_018366 [Oedothorax gibbosus]